MNITPHSVEDIIFDVIHYNNEDLQVLIEGKDKGRKLIGNYSYKIHPPHNSTGDYHVHLSDKGNEILSINRNGTAHDGYHGVRIPNKAFKALQSKFPEWKWPENQIIESYLYTTFINLDDLNGLRIVRVFDHQDYSLRQRNGFIGFFHQFGDVPFQVGGGGWVSRTVAVVEDIEGAIHKVPLNSFKFLVS